MDTHLKEEYQPFIDKTWKELKDFQRQTVMFVYNKLYVENNDKFLVADEVGLGKTIVAKGLIAKAFENFKPTPKNPTFNVIYICSNQVLARENLKKLNFTDYKNVVEDPLNRLIYLAFKKKRDKSLLKFDSLTPSTSLNITQHSGAQYERAIIYSLLVHYQPFFTRKNGLKWLLKGGVEPKNWEGLINGYYEKRKEKFEPETFRSFKIALQAEKVTPVNLPKFYKYIGSRDGITIWDALLSLCRKIDSANHDKINFKNEIIVCLRKTLTKVCLKYLGADLIILDEFQRYAEILGTNADGKISAATELAQAVLDDLEGTKVLMLSATPFKPYTTLVEQEKGEDHYQEFQRVLKFLMRNNSDQFWHSFENERRTFFSKINNPVDTLKDLPAALRLKNSLQKKYNKVIVRTERIKVSDDQNVMIKSALDSPLPVSLIDIKDFIVFDKLIQRLKENGHFKIASPIEYSKSCPFPLSFLDGYQLKENLAKMLSVDSFAKYFKESKSAWINLSQINNYHALGNGKESSIVPNSKMQYLIDKLNENNAWKWLWVPPIISYYVPEKIYPASSDFSKTLIFSSWKMVPRAISTLLSYEAERKSMNRYFQLNKEDKPQPYFTNREDKRKRKPTPILTFKMKAGTSTSSAMSLFTILYPSKYLAELFDPETNIFKQKSISELIENLAIAISKEFNRLKLNRFISEEGTSERWYWATALLIDKYKYTNETDFSKLLKDLIKLDVSIKSDTYSKGEEVTGKNEKLHIQDLLNSLNNPGQIGLGPLPDDLFEVLALMCLSSPSISFLRSVKKLMNEEFSNAFKSAYLFGISNMHFFNKPENIAIVKSELPNDVQGYWETVLKYCLQGNIQSMIDEFMHLLLDARNNLGEIQLFFNDVLSLRTSTIKVDDLNSFTQKATKKLRTHYAVDFGTQDVQTDSGTGRVLNVRQAFNSPYRPFVLASTSIGQEGLDFHYYCSSVMHWNLPGNAIDIEQREGRINRYKGLIIRKNVAKKYLQALTPSHSKVSIWEALFNQAAKIEGKSKKKCELVPYWHIEPDGDLKIERIVPLYPFSHDIDKYQALIDTLTYYRLTFGQPRQEELVNTLQQSGLSDQEIEILRKYLLIDLSPKN